MYVLSENLKALVSGVELTSYQRALALKEYNLITKIIANVEGQDICGNCGSMDLVEFDDHFTNCQDCLTSFVK